MKSFFVMRHFYMVWISLVVLVFSCQPVSHTFVKHFEISGELVYYKPDMQNGSHELLEDVTIYLYADERLLDSSLNASFSFDRLPAGFDYTLVPEKKNMEKESITEDDLALFESYLNGSIEMSVFQQVAADLDGDQQVNEVDLRLLTDCIDQNTEVSCFDYKFIDSRCTNLDERQWIDEIIIHDLNGDQKDIMIFAVKAGSLK